MVCLSITGTLLLTGCSTSSSEDSLRPRTADENQSIRDSWYPIRNSECQLIVDSFALIAAAIGGDETKYLSENLEDIRRRLENTGEITSQTLLRLANQTNDESIKSYALEAVPVFARVGDILVDSDEDYLQQMNYLKKYSNLTGKVPNGCKS